nr:hypothetical protein [Prescottella equi]
MDASEPSASGTEAASAPPYEKFFASVRCNQKQEIHVRDFIAMWGYRRRGSTLVYMIESELERRGLVSVPDIASADYYSKVTVLDRRDLSSQETSRVGWPISSVLDEDSELIGVGPDTRLNEVETIMVMKNYSQLPVLSKNRRELLGTVAWKSLARWRGDRSTSTAREAMVPGGYIAKSSDGLLAHISAIIENEFIYIQSPSREIVGILTATDLAESFLETSGPFIKIGEIEQRIRTLVDRLPIPEIQASKNGGDESREVRSASDLTFGEYIRAVENPDRWATIGSEFDRGSVIENLKSVNQVRNDVMHFRPRPLEPEKIRALDWCLNWLRETRTT